MYGLCDAPRAWYEEAAERILRAGADTIVRHPLDACLFMCYEPTKEEVTEETERPLTAVFGIHVDDLIGCGDFDSPHFKSLEKLHGIFTFREWQDSDELEYCGSQLLHKEDVLRLSQASRKSNQSP